jgi:1-acyl-sn-glycerol-3-phosphate acyltransferase
MPYSAWKRLGDFRYFLYNPLLDIPVLGSVLRGLGCFPAKYHTKYPYGLGYATEQLSKGRSIFIFPEGRRTIQGEYPAHNGVAVLAKLPRVMIIPAHIEWRDRGAWHGFKIGIGKPFNGKDLTAQEILNRVYEVPVDKPLRIRTRA